MFSTLRIQHLAKNAKLSDCTVSPVLVFDPSRRVETRALLSKGKGVLTRIEFAYNSQKSDRMTLKYVTSYVPKSRPCWIFKLLLWALCVVFKNSRAKGMGITTFDSWSTGVYSRIYLEKKSRVGFVIATCNTAAVHVRLEVSVFSTMPRGSRFPPTRVESKLPVISSPHCWTVP